MKNDKYQVQNKNLVQYICNEFNVSSFVSTCLFLLLAHADGLE